MASQGLKGYWGAEQLDRTGLPSWQLCLVMAVFAIALGNGLMVLIGMMEPNENAFVSDPDNDGRMARLVAMISIAQLYLVIALFRLFDKDLAVLPLADDLAGQCRSQLQSGRSLRLGCVAIGLVYGLLLFPVVISLVDARDPSLVQTFTYLADSGSAAVVCFVVTPLHGVITGMGLAMIVAQVRCLGHAANGISIDFLRLNECSALANPGVRLLVALIPLFCLLLLMRFLGDDPVGIAFLDQVLIFVTLFALLLILPFGYPVWVLRNRIRDAKADAMADVLIGEMRSAMQLKVPLEVEAGIGEDWFGAK